jgi:hypothetical protein
MYSNIHTLDCTIETAGTAATQLPSGRSCSVTAVRLLITLTEDLCGFPHSLKEISKHYLKTGHDYPNLTFIYSLSTFSLQSNSLHYSQSNLSRVANPGTDQSLLLEYEPASDTRRYEGPQLSLPHDITHTDAFISRFLSQITYSRKAPVTFVMSVSSRTPARTYQLGPHWTDFRDIWHWTSFKKSCHEKSSLDKIGQKYRPTLHEDLSTF